MAGFEVIVRPVVFPDIRPQKPRVLPPEDDPTQGFAEIGGGGGQLIELPYSYSYNMSRTMQQIEQARASDTARVYQEEEPKGEDKKKGARKKINKDNFVDLQVMKAVIIQDDKGKPQEIQYRPIYKPKLAQNVELLEVDKVEWIPAA